MRHALLAAVLLLGGANRAFAVTYLAMEVPRNVTREAPTSFVVTARSENGTRLTGYLGTVHFTGDSSMDLPADYTFTAADAGQHTFTAVFHRGYEKTFQISDDTGAIGGGAEVYVFCPELTLSATYDHPMCPNPGSSVTLNASTNAASPSFLWQKIKGAGPELNQTGQTVVVSIGGSWAVGMTDSATGCYTIIPVEIPYEQGPVMDAPAETYGDFTASIANSPGGPYTGVEWVITGGTIVSGQGTHTVTVHPTTTSSVDVRVSAVRTSTGCRVARAEIVDVEPAPLSATITTSSEVCPNATGTASVPDAGAGTMYTWTIQNGQIVSGQGTRQITFSAPASGVILLGSDVLRSGYGISSSASVIVGPAAEVVSPDARVCSGVPTTINATLTGTPPFRVVWSDGVEQTGIMSSTASRSVTLEEGTAYSLTSVSDAMCTGATSGSVFLDVMEGPEIVTQPASQTIAPGKTATLSVAAGGATNYWWYEGTAGDRTRFRSGGSATFTTPKLTKTTSYWVEVQNECGIVDSVTAVVTVAAPPSKRRSVRR